MSKDRAMVALLGIQIIPLKDIGLEMKVLPMVCLKHNKTYIEASG